MVARQLGAIKQTMAMLSALIRHLLPTTHGSKPAYVHSLGLRPHPHRYYGPLSRPSHPVSQFWQTVSEDTHTALDAAHHCHHPGYRGQRSDIKQLSITYMNVGVVWECAVADDGIGWLDEALMQTGNTVVEL